MKKESKCQALSEVVGADGGGCYVAGANRGVRPAASGGHGAEGKCRFLECGITMPLSLRPEGGPAPRAFKCGGLPSGQLGHRTPYQNPARPAAKAAGRRGATARRTQGVRRTARPSFVGHGAEGKCRFWSAASRCRFHTPRSGDKPGTPCPRQSGVVPPHSISEPGAVSIPSTSSGRAMAQHRTMRVSSSESKVRGR